MTAKRLGLYALMVLTRVAADAPIFWMFYFLHVQRTGPGGWPAVLQNGALFLAFAVAHSLLARDFAKGAVEKLVGRDYQRAVYVIAAGVMLALVLWFWQPLSGSLWRTTGLVYWGLTALYLASIGAMFWTTLFFDYADFVGIRVFLRKLRGQPAKPLAFSVRGPYAHCRHPMYLFLLIALWVGPHMSYTRLEFAVVASAYLLVGTLLEERNLRKELGEVYDLYCANVPMWVPRPTPWKYDGQA